MNKNIEKELDANYVRMLYIMASDGNEFTKKRLKDIVEVLL